MTVKFIRRPHWTWLIVTTPITALAALIIITR